MDSRRLDMSDFISPALDAPASEGLPTPILILTTPRTAGHTLCRFFTMAGWGVPMEYFNPDFAIPLYRRWTDGRARVGATWDQQLKHYADLLLTHRSPGGVLAIKLFPDQHAFWADTIEPGIPPERVKLVFLERKDRKSQLLSALALCLTRRPSFNGDYVLQFSPRIEVVDEAVVRQTHRILEEWNGLWRRRLAAHPGTSVSLTMEDLLDDPAGEMARLASVLGLPLNREAVEACAALERGGVYGIDGDVKARLEQEFGGLIESLLEQSP